MTVKGYIFNSAISLIIVKGIKFKFVITLGDIFELTIISLNPLISYYHTPSSCSSVSIAAMAARISRERRPCSNISWISLRSM